MSVNVGGHAGRDSSQFEAVRRKYLSMVSLAVIAPLGLTGLVTTSLSRDAHRSSVEDQARLVIKHAQESVQQRIASAEQLVAQWADSDAIHASVAFSARNGFVPQWMLSRLSELVGGVAVCDRARVLDRAGRVIADTDGRGDPAPIIVQGLVESLADDGSPSILTTRFVEHARGARRYCAAPIRGRDDGKFVGCLLVDMAADQLLRVVRDTKFEGFPAAQAFVVTSDGIVLQQPNLSSDSTEAPIPTDLLRRAATPGEEPWQKAQLPGAETVVFHAVRIPEADCFLGVAVPTSAFERAVGAVSHAASIAAMIGFVGALIVGLVVARRTSTQIRRLTEKSEALRAANVKAEAASRAKGDFLANMSHEIRTPMNGVVGMVDLLFTTELDDEQREFAETIRNSADALLVIINDVLDFSKIEAGKICLEKIPFDMQLLVEEVANLLAANAHGKGLELVVRYDPKADRMIIGDPSRVRQILTNLASNAIKFTEHGHVLIEAEVVEDRGDEMEMRISVEDTGIGMAAHAIESIFEEFTQADSSTTRKYGGTGLGLAISRRLAMLHGGEMTVVSTEGQGSTFSFTIVVGRCENPNLSTCSGLLSLDGIPVVVVDDNATNRRILFEQISNWGMRCATAATGREGLAMLRQAIAEGNPYRVAILDYQMPEMDGAAVIQALRDDPLLAGLPVVVLTSGGDPRLTLGAEDRKVIATLSKPARQEQLQAAIRLALGSAFVRKPAVRDASGSDQDSASTNRPLRVLVADDNLVNQRVTVRMLEKLGHQPVVVSDGAEAVRAYLASTFDIVLMDCQMPRVDGMEATAKIRKFEEGKEQRIPIVALTASALLGDAERCIAADMDDHLTKPIQRKELEQTLAKWAPKVESEVVKLA